MLCTAALMLGAAPFRALAAPLEPAALEEMESLLRELGFDPGPVDGVVDAQTIEAIRRYQAFALLPGEPEPDEKLLNELRGVAAAFAALNAEKAPPSAAPTKPAPLPDLGTGPEMEAKPVPEPVADKIVVPPPPAPPKLKPPETEAAAQAEAAPEVESEQQVAALPPAEQTSPQADAEAVDPLQTMIEEELAPHRGDLESGKATPGALAKQFNTEGRRLLQAADYDGAIRKFTVAIHLDPDFAGAYSNRGTAYQRQDAPDLAKDDFDKAKQLGFGGFRVRDGKNPLN